MTQGRDILDTIPDSRPVRAFLPLITSEERYRVHCVYRKTSPPAFDLLFSAGMLPVDAIDPGGTAIISIDLGGPNLSIEAKIKAIKGEQVLEMVTVKSMSHAQMREFFRVDANAAVIGRSFRPEIVNDLDSSWSLAGRTIDISGNGILVAFPQEPPMDSQIRLEITLPTSDMEVISALARPVRSQKIGDRYYEVAYHFVDISNEDRDKIIGCCLVLQRKLLRLRVQVRDQEIQ
ncbi:MAG: PilZ domain-containing protein [Desulfobulbaceae bacterium]|nr:MAG: PilZ domain-containing protein [Desulfobulbaceae bacterium]